MLCRTWSEVACVSVVWLCTIMIKMLTLKCGFGAPMDLFSPSFTHQPENPKASAIPAMGVQSSTGRGYRGSVGLRFCELALSRPACLMTWWHRVFWDGGSRVCTNTAHNHSQHVCTQVQGGMGSGQPNLASWGLPQL